MFETLRHFYCASLTFASRVYSSGVPPSGYPSDMPQALPAILKNTRAVIFLSQTL